MVEATRLASSLMAEDFELAWEYQLSRQIHLAYSRPNIAEGGANIFELTPPATEAKQSGAAFLLLHFGDRDLISSPALMSMRSCQTLPRQGLIELLLTLTKWRNERRGCPGTGAHARGATC